MAAVTGTAIAADATRWTGQGYVFGGNASRPGRWDCSSFVSYVLGHDLGLPLPNGGKWGAPGFPPNSHGPTTGDYASWTAAETIPGPPQAGDLAIWVGQLAEGHIGICQGPNTMVSALNPSAGTVQTPIVGYGPPGSPLIYRRITAAAGSSGGSATAGGVPRALLGALVAFGSAALELAGITLLLLAGLAAGGFLLWRSMSRKGG